MYFKRKAYDMLLKWKNDFADKYAVMLEGARRVGKSTIAECFAKNDYGNHFLKYWKNVSIDETGKLVMEN